MFFNFKKIGNKKMYQEVIKRITDTMFVKHTIENNKAMKFYLSLFLCYAVIKDNIDVIKYLLNKGADINTQNGNPITLAIVENNFTIAKLLINYGAAISREHIQNVLLKNNKKFIEYFLKLGLLDKDSNIYRLYNRG